MNLYYPNGAPYFGVFKEIFIPGQGNKAYDPPTSPLYTIEEQDNELPSAHKIYMNSMTEYDAAMKLFGSFKYWKEMLKGSIKIRALIEEWREEKMLRDQDKARRILWEEAEKGNIGAARVIYEAKKEEAQQKAAMREQRNKESSEQEVLEDRLHRLNQLKKNSKLTIIK